MTKYSDVMIDIETLSVFPDATILSISAVSFDPFDIDPDIANYPTLDLLISLDGQEQRSIQDETVNWWARQSSEVQAKIFSDSGRVSMPAALEELTKFVWNKNRIWAQGVTLDITVLAHAYQQVAMPVPWPYHIVRDSRTLLDLTDVEQDAVTHDSLLDAFRQVTGVQQAIARLGVKKFIKFR